MGCKSSYDDYALSWFPGCPPWSWNNAICQIIICFDDGPRQMFMSAVSDELPFGKRYGSTVWDLVVELHRWRKVPYLYFCVLGLDGDGVDRELALVSIEMLSYRLVPNTSQDSILVNAFQTFGGDAAKSLRPTWIVHGVNANSERFVFDAKFCSEGRLGYYNVAGTSAFCC